MKCEWVRENILLFVYNELPDDARYELEQHVARCGDCAGELKATRVFHATLSSLPVEEPTPNLLTASRMRLQEALETTEQGGLWQKLTFALAGLYLHVEKDYSGKQVQRVHMLLGKQRKPWPTFTLPADRGDITVSDVMETAPGPERDQAIHRWCISGIRSIIQEPGSDKVSIKYDATTTQQTEGSINDQRIQQLLLFAARNNYNSGVRMDSVDLLTQKPDDTRVREALLYALRYDSNPGVRLKALEGLSSYVKDDVRVRDTLLEALMNDSNAGVRTRALQLLEPVQITSFLAVKTKKLLWMLAVQPFALIALVASC